MKHDGRIVGDLLLDIKQPFGQVHKDTIMPENISIMQPMENQLGGNRMVGNNGFDHAPPIKDSPNPDAEAYACRGLDSPLTYWTGKPGR
jgi:hypothetical protein